MSGTIQSNNVYLNGTTPLTVISGGGGGSVPADLTVSTLSAFGLLNISSINGAPYVGAGSIPANLTVSSISTLALNNISSINGVAYTGAGSVPSNLVVSSLTAVSSVISSLTVSTINGNINPDDIPYLFLQTSGLTDRVISSINTGLVLNKQAIMSTCGAALTGNFSTQRGHQYLTQGFARLTPVGGVANWPPGTPNAYVSVFGGGGPSQSWANAQSWSYPQLSSLSGLIPGGSPVDLQWSAPGGFSIFNPDTGALPTTSTIQYRLYCSPDWPIPINVEVSTVIAQLAALGFQDTANVSIVDLGNFNNTPPV